MNQSHNIHAAMRVTMPSANTCSLKINRKFLTGVGQHPHRGFETVTLAYQGEVEHADSVGNRDVIGAGDVQWMTAGRGIIHQEFHGVEFSKKGGIFEMCQLWVNLPKDYKMIKPKYQPILANNIPTVEIYDISSINEKKDESRKDGECVIESVGNGVGVVGNVRVIAGSFQNKKGPALTFSPVELWDVSFIKKNAVVDFLFPDIFSCIVFVRRGEISIVGENQTEVYVGPQSAALTDKHGNVIRVRSGTSDTSLLIMGGLPLNEPIAARGPFVMNTWDEILQANRDFQSGSFGY